MGRSYQQLSLVERIELQVQRDKGRGIRAAGWARSHTLLRAASTVSREVRRNGGRPRPLPFSATEARQRARQLSSKARVERKPVAGTAAWASVLEQFSCGLSPEQAARTLKRMPPESPELHFSHETIYQATLGLCRAATCAQS